MLTYPKTPAAAAQLNAPYHRLIGLIRYGLIRRPAKDSSGDYLWSPEDLAAARRALERRPPRRASGTPPQGQL